VSTPQITGPTKLALSYKVTMAVRLIPDGSERPDMWMVIATRSANLVDAPEYVCWHVTYQDDGTYLPEEGFYSRDIKKVLAEFRRRLQERNHAFGKEEMA
jgi:hypothetical protein